MGYGGHGVYTLADLGDPLGLPNHYGAESGGKELPPEISQAAEIISAAVGAQANTPEELQARIANLQATKKRFPGMSGILNSRIRRLKGRLAAVQREEAETSQWRVLGQSAAGVGILVGFGMLGLLIVASQSVSRQRREDRTHIQRRLAQRNPRRRNRRRRR